MQTSFRQLFNSIARFFIWVGYKILKMMMLLLLLSYRQKKNLINMNKLNVIYRCIYICSYLHNNNNITVSSFSLITPCPGIVTPPHQPHSQITICLHFWQRRSKSFFTISSSLSLTLSLPFFLFLCLSFFLTLYVYVWSLFLTLSINLYIRIHTKYFLSNTHLSLSFKWIQNLFDLSLIRTILVKMQHTSFFLQIQTIKS